MFNIIGGLIGQGIDFFKEKQKAKHQTKMREITSKDSWDNKQIEKADKWTRRLSFILFSWPMVTAVFAPATAQQAWAAMESAPDWYVQAYMGITGAIWGISEFKRMIPDLIAKVKTAKKKKAEEKDDNLDA